MSRSPEQRKPPPRRSSRALKAAVRGLVGRSALPLYAPANAMEQQPERRVGPITLGGVLGVGGMGTVHLAREDRPDGSRRLVAVKRLHPHLATEQEATAVLLTEARLTARVDHPHVVRALDVVETEHERWLVLEYVDGDALAQLQSTAPVPIPVALRIVVDLLRGLHAAHGACDEHGTPLALVHRDVSPHNTLVGVDGVTRVADFGVAKAAHRLYSTRGARVKGKLGYVAPEALRGERATPRFDVYGAGVTLWETLTGRRLIESESEGELVLRSLSGGFPAPHELRPGVDLALSQAIMRALALAPAQRYATAAAFADALEAAAPLATHDEVAAWVREVGAAHAQRRRALVQALLEERTPPRPQLAHRSSARRAFLFMGLATAFAVTLAAGWRALPNYSASLPSAASASTPATPPPPSRAASSEPGASARTPPSRPEPSSTATTAPVDTPGSRTTRRPPTPRPTTTGAPTAPSADRLFGRH